MRCPWAKENEPLYIEYHDKEWGRPLKDDQQLFEMLCLEGAQAGLSWITILKKREAYREAFDQFDPYKIALYDEEKINFLIQNEGIIRNRRKITAFIENAKAYIRLIERGESFTDYLWKFVNHEPIQNHYSNMKEVPASTPISEKMSKELKKDGFKFVGPTICYAFMQAVGMVNDHLVDCDCYEGISSRKGSR